MSRLPSLLLVALIGCGGAEVPAPPDAAGVGVVDADGVVAAIAAHRGRPLLVNFWAIWCDPCVEELPDLAAVGRELRAAGGAVLGVAMDLTAPGQELGVVRARLPGFAKEHGVDFPIVLYGSGDPIPLIERLDLPGPIPVTLAIARDGRIVGMHEGRASRDDFRELARRAVDG